MGVIVSARPAWREIKEARSYGETPAATANRVLAYLAIRRGPVPIDVIAMQLGVPVQATHSTWSGAVKSDADRARIWVRATDPRVRRRFTIAHELGHLLLHPEGQEFRDETFSGNPRETEANRFAAQLLMPDWMLEPLLKNSRTDAAELAVLFDVSEPAMKVRLATLLGRPVDWF